MTTWYMMMRSYGKSIKMKICETKKKMENATPKMIRFMTVTAVFTINQKNPKYFCFIAAFARFFQI